ncbi:ferrous iron transport protein A [Marinilongibacter aquaticus]|uniref:FeoA family protein n=1 Tax=Marinilongibacter aquaticus TaxID=2975157 RepID=UPI0021BD8E5D|nr:FeoA family protein [Marinilongibacter aquaticus]UBM60116.1 ferrous iron transport protein A [Marinilongibacter aquaticus]
MKNPFLTLADLKDGQSAIVKAFHDMSLSLRLMQLGIIPGTPFRMDRSAPFGCPVCISMVGDYHLSLRRSEAESIEIELI